MTPSAPFAERRTKTMEKMNCEIIRDLIPSYVDGICSEATKRCVEEHIAACDGCRQMLAAYKANVLSGEKLERKGLDGLKKIRKKMKLQNIVCYLVLIFLIYCGIEVFIANHTNYAMFNNTTLLLVICILANLLASLGYKAKNSPEKTQYLLGVASLILDLYFAFLFFYSAVSMASGSERLFGMELLNVGPFLERQLTIAFVAQLAFFGCNLWAIIRQDRNCGWLLNLNITGIFLMINYDIWLKQMDSFETLRAAILRDTLEPFAVCILGMAASLILTKTLRKKED